MLSSFMGETLKYIHIQLGVKKIKSRAKTEQEKKKNKKKKSHPLGEAAVAITAGALMTAIT